MSVKRVRKKVLSQYKKRGRYFKGRAAGEVAKELGIVVGELGCPNCGATSIGTVEPVCPMCNESYFSNEIYKE